MSEQTGSDAAPVRQAIAGAPEASSPAGEASEPPHCPKLGELPPGCPVQPLGMNGDLRYYLDAEGQFSTLHVEKHTRLRIAGLFGSQNHLIHQYWPRTNAKGDVKGWRSEDAAELFMRMAAERGMFSPLDRVRGRGCWRDANGSLCVHTGTDVLAGARWRRPGLFGDHVLPAAVPILKPAPIAEPGRAGGVGEEALSLFHAWNWRRPIDARLLLGWVGCAFLGAALRWRPIVWIVGASATGKSTLQTALSGLLGGWILSVLEPTPAAIWQTLRYDCLAIAIDEAEAGENGPRLTDLVKLARLCASGGKLIRGGADHEAAEFVLRSAVLFSSIRQPSLLQQDRSRMILLRLAELLGERPPDLAPDRLRALGARILRRLVDGWPRFAGAIEQYRAALAAVGHRGRTADVFGHVLAAADVILSDHDVDTDSAAELAAQLDIESLPEAEDNLSDQEAWLRHLMSSLIPFDGPGTKSTVSEWLRRAVVNDPFDAERSEADRILANHGIKILRSEGGQRLRKPERFAVANRHAGLVRLHAGTHWAGRSGAIGGWVQAARDLPGAGVTTQRFAGLLDKGTSLPLELVLSLEAETASQSLPLEAGQ